MKTLVPICLAGVLALSLHGACGDDAETALPSADPMTQSDGAVVDAGTDPTPTPTPTPTPDAALSATAATCKKVAQYCEDSPYALYLDPLTEDNCNTVFQCLLDTYAPSCVARWQAVMDCIDASVASVADCNQKCWPEMIAFMSNCECLTRCGVTNCSGSGLDAGVPTDTACGMPDCPDA